MFYFRLQNYSIQLSLYIHIRTDKWDFLWILKKNYELMQYGPPFFLKAGVPKKTLGDMARGAHRREICLLYNV